MQITKNYLKHIIKEELNILLEAEVNNITNPEELLNYMADAPLPNYFVAKVSAENFQVLKLSAFFRKSRAFDEDTQVDLTPLKDKIPLTDDGKYVIYTAKRKITLSQGEKEIKEINVGFSNKGEIGSITLFYDDNSTFSLYRGSGKAELYNAIFPDLQGYISFDTKEYQRIREKKYFERRREGIPMVGKSEDF